jgi:hypothetical protein
MRLSGGWHGNQDLAGLFAPQAEAVPAKAELDRVPKRRAVQHFDGCTATEPHLQQPSPELLISADADNVRAATVLKTVQGARPTTRT